jgi:hypothetical protein
MSEAHLPDEFWRARKSLAAVRDAAWSRQRSPDAVLGSVLCYLAASLPAGVMLPAIVGAEVGLGFVTAAIASTGGGKTGGIGIGQDLLFGILPDDLRRVPVGTGEGMAAAYYGMVEDAVTGKKRLARAHTRRLFFSDEGQKAIAQGARAGATLFSTIRTAWSGGLIGEGNADPAKNRPVEEGTYSWALVMGFQPEAIAPLLDDAAGGTPGRFFYDAAYREKVGSYYGPGGPGYRDLPRDSQGKFVSPK